MWHKAPCSSRDYSGVRESGPRKKDEGDDGGEVVGEDCGDDDGPRWHSDATGSEGERAPLLLILPWPPL